MGDHPEDTRHVVALPDKQQWPIPMTREMYDRYIGYATAWRREATRLERERDEARALVREFMGWYRHSFGAKAFEHVEAAIARWDAEAKP